MSALSFLIALAALCIGTYVMRFAGVKVGAAMATRGRKGEGRNEDSTPAVTKWMDRATVVLIAAVCATTAVFDGKDIADPARLLGVGVGVLASILRIPLLICVFLGMGVCALIRHTGML